MFSKKPTYNKYPSLREKFLKDLDLNKENNDLILLEKLKKKLKKGELF